MNAVATESPAGVAAPVRTFTTRMIGVNTFVLSLGARTIEIVRSDAELDAREQARLAVGLGGVTSTWTASIVTPTKERRQVARRGGHFVDPVAKCTAVELDRLRLNEVIDAARWYADALDRLTVMVERAFLALSPNASKKTRVQMIEAGLRLAACDLIGGGNSGAAYIVVAGETVFAVSREHKSKRVDERSYTIGDTAVYGGFNLAYIGTIVNISPKTIKIVDDGVGHVLKHSEFASWNHRPIECSYKRNAAWSD